MAAEFETLQPTIPAEMHRTTEGKLVESYANGKVRIYEGPHFRTTIDIPEFNTHVLIKKIDFFELNHEHEVTEVIVRKGHHKGKIIMGYSEKPDGVSFEYNSWSPEGIVGTSYGKRLDLAIASLFYTDNVMTEVMDEAGMDEAVRRYLKFEIITAGRHLHTVNS